MAKFTVKKLRKKIKEWGLDPSFNEEAIYIEISELLKGYDSTPIKEFLHGNYKLPCDKFLMAAIIQRLKLSAYWCDDLKLDTGKWSTTWTKMTGPKLDLLTTFICQKPVALLINLRLWKSKSVTELVDGESKLLLLSNLLSDADCKHFEILTRNGEFANEIKSHYGLATTTEESIKSSSNEFNNSIHLAFIHVLDGYRELFHNIKQSKLDTKQEELASIRFFNKSSLKRLSTFNNGEYSADIELIENAMQRFLIRVEIGSYTDEAARNLYVILNNGAPQTSLDLCSAKCADFLVENEFVEQENIHVKNMQNSIFSTNEDNYLFGWLTTCFDGLDGVTFKENVQQVIFPEALRIFMASMMLENYGKSECKVNFDLNKSDVKRAITRFGNVTDLSLESLVSREITYPYALMRNHDNKNKVLREHCKDVTQKLFRKYEELVSLEDGIGHSDIQDLLIDICAINKPDGKRSYLIASERKDIHDALNECYEGKVYIEEKDRKWLLFNNSTQAFWIVCMSVISWVMRWQKGAIGSKIKMRHLMEKALQVWQRGFSDYIFKELTAEKAMSLGLKDIKTKLLDKKTKNGTPMENIEHHTRFSNWEEVPIGVVLNQISYNDEGFITVFDAFIQEHIFPELEKEFLNPTSSSVVRKTVLDFFKDQSDPHFPELIDDVGCSKLNLFQMGHPTAASKGGKITVENVLIEPSTLNNSFQTSERCRKKYYYDLQAKISFNIMNAKKEMDALHGANGMSISELVEMPDFQNLQNRSIEFVSAKNNLIGFLKEFQCDIEIHENIENVSKPSYILA